VLHVTDARDCAFDKETSGKLLALVRASPFLCKFSFYVGIDGRFLGKTFVLLEVLSAVVA
jgi:hypothetical protein